MFETHIPLYYPFTPPSVPHGEDHPRNKNEDTEDLINSEAYTAKLNEYRGYGYDFNTSGRGTTLRGNSIIEVYPKFALKNCGGVNTGEQNEWIKLAQSVGTSVYTAPEKPEEATNGL